MKNILYVNFESDGSERPIWLVINFDLDGIPWSQKRIDINVSRYTTENVSDLMDDVIGTPVFMRELTLSRIYGKHIGINLESLQSRLWSEQTDPSIVERLILLVSDIAEIISIDEEMFL
ncbi:hypothetical protein GCM10011391_28510 [Pullulanibacillus camelliae]|uniref:Uncharacterized protein n=1 Tax=Pullulanibacillus camelliae TaxID=1707096 RepID=A0A8J2YK48_9BACL|nr:hypothetical protein [Pullulanibacillus camelliae]GGE48027.1 hypothetical protein GCM10011391_28510 [Pullulanibacillus camelliae]